MSFLAPAAFALAALIPIIIAMYLLKLRRTEQVVSSVYLWRRMVRDVEANAPWQRLRRNLLLILQLLFMATLILALARPFRWVQGAGGQALILILDTSASMAATDVLPSRLEAAKTQAGGLVDDLPDDARVTVIAASQSAQVLVSSSQDRRQIHQAIQTAQVSPGGSDLTAAIELASAVAARQPATEIVVLSDGRVNLPQRLAVKGRLRYLPLGQSGNNQAISTLSLETVPGGGDLTAFAQVTNYGDDAVERRLTLYADGQLIDAYDLEIPAGDVRAVVADGLPVGTRILEARLTGEDVLPLDDRAWSVQRNTPPTPITLVTEGNLFLETGLALLSNLEVTTVRPEDLEEGWKLEGVEDESAADASQPSSPPANQPPSLTLFDAYVPITATLPAGNLLFIAPPRGTDYFTVTGTVDLPTPRPVDPEDPLLAYVNLAEVNVLQAVRMPLPPWGRPVVTGDLVGDATPLLFAGEVDGRRIAVLTFDLHHSDLPLQVAFPLLLANLTNWLAPGSGGDLPAQVSPGAPVALPPPPETQPARVIRPDGSSTQLAPEGGRAVFADTFQLGVYRVTWQPTQSADGEEVEQRFAVNLFSPQESDVRPAATLPLLESDEGEKGERAQQARREWWRLLALLALALLTAEWLVYHRATLARLWARARQMVMSTELLL